jgi:P27 family predicted phage terminase small subunit
MRKTRTPTGLKYMGRKFWKETLQNFELSDPHDLEMLKMAGSCLDRMKENTETIEKTGRFFDDRFGQPKPHPAAKEIKDDAALFARLCREMGLDIEPLSENRIPSRY